MTITQNKHKSLVHQLEDTVLCLEAAGETEQDIFSMVHMIMRGFIRDGELTQEYIDLAKQVHHHQTTRVIDTPPGLLDSTGNPIR